MPNRYCNLVGTNKIKDEYTKINDGFDTVEQEMDAKLPKSGGRMTGPIEFDSSDYTLEKIGSALAQLAKDGFSFISGKNGVYLAYNAYRDASDTWQRYDTTQPSALIALSNGTSGKPRYYYANAGTGAISWTTYDVITTQDSGPFFKGAGSPEGVVTAPVGSIYQRTDGGASTTLYVKESGTGNTGWKAVQTA